MLVEIMVIIVGRSNSDNLKGRCETSLTVDGRCEASVIIATM